MGSDTRKVKRIQAGPCQCHPRVGSVRPAEGCLPKKILDEAAHKLGVPASPSGPELRKLLESHLNVRPINEYSFLMKLPLSSDIKRRLQGEYLRPMMPRKWKDDPDTWLDSLNIEHVMNQYEEVFPNFEFMGPFPIDFGAANPYQGGAGKCLMNEMCELRVTKAKQSGTDYLGIVYNLDPHYKSGSHWIANFIDLKNHKCYFFDSYGMPPPPQVEKFMKWLTTQDSEMKLEYSARRLQYKNTECGVYSVYFIIRMLSGDNFVDFSRRKPSDADMLNLRKCLFST